MSTKTMKAYAQDIESKMKRLFSGLSEKDRRRYAGIESAKLAHGGLDYICALFCIDPKTVRRGLAELELVDDPAQSRVRKKAVGARN